MGYLGTPTFPGFRPVLHGNCSIPVQIAADSGRIGSSFLRIGLGLGPPHQKLAHFRDKIKPEVRSVLGNISGSLFCRNSIKNQINLNLAKLAPECSQNFP